MTASKRPRLSSESLDDLQQNCKRLASSPSSSLSSPHRQDNENNIHTAHSYLTPELDSSNLRDGDGDAYISGSTCSVPSDGSTPIVTQPISNGLRSVEGHATSRNQEICFGAICDVKAKLLDAPEIFEACAIPLVKGTNHQYYELVIFYREKNYILQSLDGMDVAVLNKQTTLCLQVNGLKKSKSGIKLGSNVSLL
ncbi:hypothetical protein AOQ84DRAFT_170618 [Glonium stellatum]|uniref:Uncharacterized protein n=1 Tax=Glonium stellatum TaxID=574774 RepID=A0A8E2EQE7_9PEZI|nr:hypothetical protein AOQ84DRAFT_170618 [Glonium stellatum]